MEAGFPPSFEYESKEGSWKEQQAIGAEAEAAVISTNKESSHTLSKTHSHTHTHTHTHIHTSSELASQHSVASFLDFFSSHISVLPLLSCLTRRGIKFSLVVSASFFLLFHFLPLY